MGGKDSILIKTKKNKSKNPLKILKFGLLWGLF
jgi:hypothetical protein